MSMKTAANRAHSIVASQGGSYAGSQWDESKHPRHPIGTPEGGEFASLMFHGSTQSLPDLQPGSMFSDDQTWAAGYTTHLGLHSETFVGKIHAFDVPAGHVLYARSVHQADGDLIRMAKKILGREPSSLREAAEVVSGETGAVAILSRNTAGHVNGGITLRRVPVRGHIDPREALRRAAGAGREIPSNLRKALG